MCPRATRSRDDAVRILKQHLDIQIVVYKIPGHAGENNINDPFVQLVMVQRGRVLLNNAENDVRILLGKKTYSTWQKICGQKLCTGNANLSNFMLKLRESC